MGYPRFEIDTDSKGEFRFNLFAVNAKNILRSSEGYTSKQNCKKAIESVKINAPDDGRYKRGTATNGQYYFTLHARNGEALGISEMYTTSANRENGIAAVKRDAPVATVIDLTI